MNEHQASRTLLKSPPELWAECSDAQSLSRHLDTFFGEIRITRLEPESTVAWEGERASGTVKLEPSGWGTRVTLTCSTVTVEKPVEPRPVPSEPAPEPQPASSEPDPAPEADASPAPRPATSPQGPSVDGGAGGLFARVRRLLAPQRPAAEPPATRPAPQATAPEPTPAQPSSPESRRSTPERPTPEPVEASEAPDSLVAALESLGQAHHRPFSRA